MVEELKEGHLLEGLLEAKWPTVQDWWSWRMRRLNAWICSIGVTF